MLSYVNEIFSDGTVRFHWGYIEVANKRLTQQSSFSIPELPDIVPVEGVSYEALFQFLFCLRQAHLLSNILDRLRLLPELT